MSNKFYSIERNIQIVLSLMKAHGIKYVVASPGSSDVAVLESMQNDNYFKMFSCVDERSAAYMACGISAEVKEPVAIVCTGATSSRNYMPGLTEAFYRHLPVLAITCSQSNAKIGHYVNQVTDRNCPPSDVVKTSVYCQAVNTPQDEWDVVIKANHAMLELRRNGGGPTHINLCMSYTYDFSAIDIKPVRLIQRYSQGDNLPDITACRIGVFVGNHLEWSDELTSKVETFCEKYNAVVLFDHTSNYKGKYGVLLPLISDQFESHAEQGLFDLVIHIGYVSSMTIKAKETWRVNPDGEIRDTFGVLTNVFQMSEDYFFSYYVDGYTEHKDSSFASELQERYTYLMDSIPDLPFSNLWVAQKLSRILPDNSVLHLGIRNSLRSWSYFEIPSTVRAYSNTGGFGIDGGVSSMIGASFIHKDTIYYGVYGDLLFFYDINAIGNRDISSNVRILLINNGLGQEFKNYSCVNSYSLGDDANSFIAAEGHNGYKSSTLVKGMAESLGFDYLTASTKEEFEKVYKVFVSSQITKPMIFEVFTKSVDEDNALKAMTMLSTKSKMLYKTSKVAPRELIKTIKKVVGK